MRFGNKGPAFQNIPFVRRHSSFFVGLFVAIPAVAVPVLLVYTLLKAILMETWFDVYAVYRNSFGLKSGNSVIISGCDVGNVKNVLLKQEGQVLVQMRINRDYWPLVNKSTRAVLKQKNIGIGDWCIELVGGNGIHGPADKGDTLIAEMPSGLDKTIEQVTALIGTIDTLVQGIAAGKGSLGRLLIGDSLANLAVHIGQNASALTLHGNTTLKHADSLLKSLTALGGGSREVVDSVMLVMSGLKATLAEAQSFVGNLRVASEEIPSMVSRLQDDLGEAEMMMNSLKKNWLIRQAVGSQPDLLLGNDP